MFDVKKKSLTVNQNINLFITIFLPKISDGGECLMGYFLLLVGFSEKYLSACAFVHSTSFSITSFPMKSIKQSDAR